MAPHLEPADNDKPTAHVSWNENGFWQGDLFIGDADCPEAFFTLKRGQTKDDAVAKARASWPGVPISVIDPEDDDGDDDFDECPTCKGRGLVNPLTAPDKFFCVGTTDCPDCDGTGRF